MLTCLLTIKLLKSPTARILTLREGVTLRDKVKSVDIRKELGVNSIKEKVREMRLRWYGHMQRMEENTEVRAVVDMILPGKRPKGDQEGDGWLASERTYRNSGSPQRMPRTEHSGNQEFGPPTPPSGKRRRRRISSTLQHLYFPSQPYLTVKHIQPIVCYFRDCSIAIFEVGALQKRFKYRRLKDLDQLQLASTFHFEALSENNS